MMWCLSDKGVSVDSLSSKVLDAQEINRHSVREAPHWFSLL